MAVTLNASTSSGFIATSDTSGSLELQANGTTKATVGSTGLSIGQYNPAASLITSGTAVSASGTSVDFTSIPSWVKRITILFNDVSTNGTSHLQLQIGAGSFTTSGYISSSVIAYNSGSGSTSATSGFVVFYNNTGYRYFGSIIIQNITGNTWVSNHSLGNYVTSVGGLVGGGNLALSGTLDRVRITTTNGTDAFDTGSINIFYE